MKFIGYNLPSKSLSTSHFHFLGGMVACVLFSLPASGQTWKNTPPPAGGNWSNSAKWTTVPVSNKNTALTFNSGLLPYTSTDDLGGTFKLNSITFNPGLVTALITVGSSNGSVLKFTSNSVGTGPSITNTSNSLLRSAGVISAPVELGDDLLVNGGGLGVIFSGGVSGKGGMIVNGAVTFAGSIPSTYKGTTTVNGYLSELNANVLSAKSDVNVATGGILAVLNNQSIGGLSGTGIVQSQLSLTATNTLSVGNGNATSQFDGTITNANNFNKLTLDKVGNGTLTLTGTNSYTGGTILDGGTVVVGNNSALGTGMITVNGSKTTISTTGTNGTTITLANDVFLAPDLTYNIDSSQPNLNVTGTISGNPGEGIIKKGNGVLILSGSNTYSGSTTVNGGRLEVANAMALGTGDVVVNGGRLSIQKNSGLTELDVTGAYTQSGGSLRLALLSPTSNETLMVGGNVILEGGTLHLGLNSVPIAVANGTVLTLVEANGLVSGQFDQLTFNPNIILPNGIEIVSYTTHEVNLGFYSFLGNISGLTPNQQRVANYVDEFSPTATGNFKQLVDNLYPLTTNPAALGSALDQLSPQSLQVWRHISFDNATFSSQLVNNHLANLRDGLTGFDGSQFSYNDSSTDASLSQIKNRLLAWNPNATPGLVSDVTDPVLAGVDLKACRGACAPDPLNQWSTFIAGNVILADLNSNQDLAYQHYTTGAVTAGADYHIDRHWTLGGLFGYGHTEATLDHIGSQTTVDTYSPAVYASYVDGGWYGNALFSYGYTKYSENRNVQIGAITGSNTSSPNGNQYVANLTGGYEFKTGAWKVGPVASAQYVNLGVNSFVEQGPTALSVQNQTDESFRSQLGFTARYAGHVQGWFGSFNLTPHISAVWQHEYLDDSRGITSQLNSVGAGSFTIQTSAPDRDSAVIDAGIDAEIEQELTLFLDYQTQVGQQNFFANSIQGGIKVAF